MYVTCLRRHSKFIAELAQPNNNLGPIAGLTYNGALEVLVHHAPIAMGI